MKGLKFALKLAFAAFIFWMVWDNVDQSQFKFVLNEPLLLAVAPLCWLLNQLLTTMRLHAVLQALDRPTQLIDVLRANMSSLFVGNLMPGIVGADVVKFFYLKKNDPSMQNSQLFFVLALDRVLGLMAVLFWCSVFGFCLNSSVFDGRPAFTVWLTYAPAGILAAMLLGLWLLNLFMGFASRLNLPTRVRDFLETYQHFRDSRDTRSLVLVLTYNLSAVFVVLAGLVVMGSQLQMHEGGEPMVALQFFLIPLVLIASMLPLTPMGIGVAQISMAGAYELFGLSSSVGVSVSTLSQMGLLMVSLVVGGACFLLSKAEMRQAGARPI